LALKTQNSKLKTDKIYPIPYSLSPVPYSLPPTLRYDSSLC